MRAGQADRELWCAAQWAARYGARIHATCLYAGKCGTILAKDNLPALAAPNGVNFGGVKRED